jgi:rhomboid protease GluP
MWGFGPVLTRLGRDMGFVPFVVTACTALYVLSLLLFPESISGLLSPGFESLFVFGASGGVPIFGYGRWWTVLTAGWLHGNLLHIGFNMMSVRNVAPIVTDFYGASRMIIIYVVGSAVGFTASSLAWRFLPAFPIIGGSGATVGASAGITALIGAILFYGHRTGSRGVGEQAKSWIWGFLLMGFLIPVIDNWAHVGGCVGGYFCAKFLDPLYPERLDHFLVALGLLGLTALAVAFSVFDAFKMLS